MELVFTLLLAIFGFTLTWLTAEGKIISGKKGKWIKWLNKSSYQVLVCGSITIFLLVGQYLYSSSREARMKTLSFIEQNRRDSINNAEVRKALLEYNLKYDSSQKVITKLIRDSLKNQVIISPLEPSIAFCDFKVTENSIVRVKVEYTICCFDASAEEVTVKIAFILKDETKGTYHSKTVYQSLAKKDFFSVGSKIDATYTFDKPLKTDFVFAYLIGSYKNKFGKSYELKLFAGYNLNTNSAGVPTESEYDRLTEQFK